LEIPEFRKNNHHLHDQCHRRERGGGGSLLATLSMTLVRERFRRLCHCCMWKTVTLRDCWSTRRGGDILHFQAYILGHAKLIDRDNILNSSD